MAKNPAAVALGKLSGKNLTKAERAARAKRAAEIRWRNKAQQNGGPGKSAALDSERGRPVEHGLTPDERNHLRDMKLQEKRRKKA